MLCRTVCRIFSFSEEIFKRILFFVLVSGTSELVISYGDHDARHVVLDVSDHCFYGVDLLVERHGDHEAQIGQYLGNEVDCSVADSFAIGGVVN